MKNYFSFISFFISSLGLTFVIEQKLIPLLAKRAKQPIYEDGPSWHLSKSGTPTMGGIAFVIAISLPLLISSLIIKETSILITVLFAVGNSLIGIFDDMVKLMKKKNAGLSPMQKLFLQTILSVIFLMSRAHFFSDNTSIKFSFGTLNLGFFYYPFALILILGVINCANLTDGIDGLASSVSAAIAIVFILLFGRSFSGVSLISLSLLGGVLGFLFFNCNPAKIFMGDTGSLFLGAMAASLAFSTANPTVIIFIGIVYVAEGVSVILQVIYYKLTKKRLFKMAPLHHHLEKSGISENRICILAVVFTFIFASLVPLIFGW